MHTHTLTNVLHDEKSETSFNNRQSYWGEVSHQNTQSHVEGGLIGNKMEMKNIGHLGRLWVR